MPPPPPSIPGARLLFSLDPSVAHLNHGSFGAVPIAVQRAQQRLRDEVEANPLRFFDIGITARLGRARAELAAFLGAAPGRAALVSNATAGIALALAATRLGPGDEVVTTDHGYGAVTLAVGSACRRTGAVAAVAPVELDANTTETVDAIMGAVTERTRLLIVDLVTSPTARLLPVAEIVAAARARSVPVMVDAAHGPGMLPLDVAALDADFWVGNMHKWAFAPRATALFAVAERRRRDIEPLIVSWQHDTGYPTAVEWQGTLDYTPWLAAPVGLAVLRSLDVDAVRAHNVALAAYGQRVVGAALGLDTAHLPDPGGPVSMRLVPLPPELVTDQPQANALRTRIARELAAEVSITLWRGRGYLRLCAQVYNHAGEYDRLAAELPKLIASLD